MTMYEVEVESWESFKVIVDADSEEEAENIVINDWAEFASGAEFVSDGVSVLEINIAENICPKCYSKLRKTSELEMRNPCSGKTRMVGVYYCDFCGYRKLGD